MPEGLEDTDASDLAMPIYRIDHDNGLFVNGLTGESFGEFDAVILGRLKQRILWPKEPGDSGDAPMCRSADFKTGIPRAEAWVQVQPKSNNLTAQKASGFDWPTVEAAAEGSGLPCESCNLKEWGQDRTPPWCNEQWTMPFARLDDEGDPILGVISFQRTGLKPCKSYVSAFVQAKSPLYTVVTRVKAIVQQRGSVSWVVPSFQRLRESDSTQWPLYSKSLLEVRTYLTTPRVFNNTPIDPDEDEVAQATTQTATISAPEQPATVAPSPDPEGVDPETTSPPEQPPARRAQPAADYDPDEEPF
jgi:hypothetical protein